MASSSPLLLPEALHIVVSLVICALLVGSVAFTIMRDP